MCKEKLRELYCRANMVRGHVVRMGDTGGACRVLVEKLRERDSLWHVWGTLEVRVGFWWGNWGKETAWKTYPWMGA